MRLNCCNFRPVFPLSRRMLRGNKSMLRHAALVMRSVSGCYRRLETQYASERRGVVKRVAAWLPDLPLRVLHMTRAATRCYTRLG
jgi:hypothetical protein